MRKTLTCPKENPDNLSDISDFEAIAILGIPIDNLSMEEALEKAFRLIDASSMSSHYIGTVNVDFLVNTLGWHPSFLRHPELLMALRRSKINTADGMPVVWLSQLLGCPLKQRISGADFIPKLIDKCIRHKKSLFILGGDSLIAEQATQKLKLTNPELLIAGTASPHIFVTGEELEKASEQDQKIIEQINHSHSDLLLIFFGNPKQEIWFQRIQHLLDVPLAIGGGGTINFISGTVSRAPQWMQNWGLEWLYRLTVEPNRLWKRYFFDLIKFSYITIPLILYHWYRKLLFRLSFQKNSSSTGNYLFPYGFQDFSILRLPESFDRRSSAADKKLLEQVTKDVLILDFRFVRFIDAQAIGLLLRLWKRAHQEHKHFYLLGISHSIRVLMKMHRVWDQFQPCYFANLEHLVAHLNSQSQSTVFSEILQTNEEFVLINFFGQIDASQDHRDHFSKLISLIEGHHVVINFNYCSFIDSSGIGFLLKIRRHVLERNKQLVLCELSENLQQIMKISKVDSLLPIFSSLNEAKNYLKKTT